MQAEELRAQREVLRLTRDEMEEQRIATQDMARSLAAQAEIFLTEKQERMEDRAWKHLLAILDWIVLSLSQDLEPILLSKGHVLRFNGKQTIRSVEIQRSSLYQIEQGHDIEATMFKLYKSLDQTVSSLLREGSRYCIDSNCKGGLRARLEEVLLTFLTLNDLQSKLSAADEQKLKNMKIQETGRLLLLLCDHWTEFQGRNWHSLKPTTEA